MAKTPLLQSVFDIAKALAPMIGPGGPAAVALASEVVTLIDNATDEFGPEATVDLMEVRDEFEAKVNAHVEDTARRLRGD